MARGKREDEPVEEESSSKSKKKWYAVGGAVLLVVVLIAGFVLFSGGDGNEGEKLAGAAEPSFVEITDPDTVLTGALMSLEPMVVNLRGGSGYIRIQVDLEYFDFVLPFDEKLHRARAHDIVIKVLSGKTPEDLLGVGDKIALRKELIEKLNTEEYYQGSAVEFEPLPEEESEEAEFYDSEVVDVYFREFVIQ